MKFTQFREPKMIYAFDVVTMSSTDQQPRKEPALANRWIAAPVSQNQGIGRLYDVENRVLKEKRHLNRAAAAAKAREVYFAYRPEGGKRTRRRCMRRSLIEQFRHAP